MVKFNNMFFIIITTQRNKCVRDDDASVRANDINKIHNRSKLKLRVSYIDTFDTKNACVEAIISMD